MSPASRPATTRSHKATRGQKSARRQKTARPSPAPAPVATPARRGDGWNAAGSGKRSALTSNQSDPAASSGNALTVALVLLGLAALGLVGGLGVAARKRSRRTLDLDDRERQQLDDLFELPSADELLATQPAVADENEHLVGSTR